MNTRMNLPWLFEIYQSGPDGHDCIARFGNCPSFDSWLKARGYIEGDRTVVFYRKSGLWRVRKLYDRHWWADPPGEGVTHAV